MKNWYSIFNFFRQPETKGKRICSKCKEPIKAKHRWHFVNNKPRHKDCKNPELIGKPLPIEELPMFKDLGI